MVDQQVAVAPGSCEGFPESTDPAVGLRENQFIPVFQPIIALRTGQLAGFEVLARWQHPTEGLIPPSRFIANAEREGWTGLLMKQILGKALAAVQDLPDTFYLAVNLSPLQLQEFSLPQQISAMASSAGVSMHRLVVEITESALIEDRQNAQSIVGELKALGCKLALDDFGTGYSSLTNLQALPFDTIKIDQSFVSTMMDQRNSRKIVSAVVGLGQSLGLSTVAEGIETQEQAEMMLRLGCEFGQGYFFGYPTSAEHLAASVTMPREKLTAKNPRGAKCLSNANLSSYPSQVLAQLEAVYDGAPIALAFVSRDLHYLNVNTRYATMNEAVVESHCGRHVSELIPVPFMQVCPYLHRVLGGEAIRDVEIKLSNKKGTALICFQPAWDEAGDVVGISLSVAVAIDGTPIDTVQVQYAS